MKRLLLSLTLLFTMMISVQAMSYDEARRRAWFLTDKMAYELDLTPEQYDRAYEINLDYLLSIRTASDCRGRYWHYRNMDLRYVLFDWQYDLYRALDYFYTPIRWVRSAWYYPICRHYRYGYYYFNRPTIYVSYQGCGWRRRSHNDISPYHNMHFSTGRSMRQQYNVRDSHRESIRYDRSDRGHNRGDRYESSRPQRQIGTDSDNRRGHSGRSEGFNGFKPSDRNNDRGSNRLSPSRNRNRNDFKPSEHRTINRGVRGGSSSERQHVSPRSQRSSKSERSERSHNSRSFNPR